MIRSRILYFQAVLRENKQSYIIFLEHPFLKGTGQSSSVNPINNKVIVVYGTCSGNAEIVSEAIRDGLCDQNLEVDLERAELVKAEIVKEYGLIVLISSTWDVGKLNMNFIEFDKGFKQLDLSNNYAAVVGLGDSGNYDVFCGAADLMEKSVEKSKASKLLDTLRIDGAVYGRLNEFREWGKILGKSFLNQIKS